MEAKKSVEAVFNTELSIYERLAQTGVNDPLSQHILMLLDSFQVIGPNGTHSFLYLNLWVQRQLPWLSISLATKGNMNPTQSILNEWRKGY